jgi:hypothetical protein
MSFSENGSRPLLGTIWLRKPSQRESVGVGGEVTEVGMGTSGWAGVDCGGRSNEGGGARVALGAGAELGVGLSAVVGGEVGMGAGAAAVGAVALAGGGARAGGVLPGPD